MISKVHVDDHLQAQAGPLRLPRKVCDPHQTRAGCDPNKIQATRVWPLAPALQEGGFVLAPLAMEMDTYKVSLSRRRAKCPSPSRDCMGLRVETANFGWIPGVSS